MALEDGAVLNDKNVVSSSSPKKLLLNFTTYPYSSPDLRLFELKVGRKKDASVLKGCPFSSATYLSFSFSPNGPRTVTLPCCCIFEKPKKVKLPFKE